MLNVKYVPMIKTISMANSEISCVITTRNESLGPTKNGQTNSLFPFFFCFSPLFFRFFFVHITNNRNRSIFTWLFPNGRRGKKRSFVVGKALRAEWRRFSSHRYRSEIVVLSPGYMSCTDLTSFPQSTIRRRFVRFGKMYWLTIFIRVHLVFNSNRSDRP